MRAHTGVANADDIVMRSGIAAFCRGPSGAISSWNEAAEAMLGHRAEKVVGKRCHTVVRGSDELGAYCCESCPSWRSATRGEPIRPFQMRVHDAADRLVEVIVVILPVNLSLVHLLEPFQTSDPAVRNDVHLCSSSACLGGTSSRADRGDGRRAELSSRRRPPTP